MNATEKALIARGVDSKLAKSLSDNYYTLGSLKQLNAEALVSLGLSRFLAEEIRSGKRPPIPIVTLHKVLYDSNNTCCVCKMHPRPTVVHHINEWHDSHSHDEENLVVLCLICHDEAHTNHKLSVNLTPAKLVDFKNRWLKEVKKSKLKQRMPLGAAYKNLAVWDYFNLKRLLGTASKVGVSIDNCAYYKDLKSKGAISKGGDLVVKSLKKDGRPLIYQYEILDFFNYTSLFYESVLRKTLLKVPVIDLSESWNKSTFNMLSSGSVAIFAGGWKFKKKDRNCPDTGPGQYRKAYVVKRGIRLEFDFDAWEVVSSSSWGNLAGSRTATAIVIIRSVSRLGKVLFIHATGLAIGTGFPSPNRDCRYGSNVLEIDELEPEEEDPNVED